ncbi:fragmin60 [Obba rivulosa]|uniref:Fragmin60 n=1 Tax=Obba rivulosa TaxID=1052685 RepID=A0A8E2AXA0_9APHY|nr:fragmin60 [Obba rivulosa]
MAHLTRSTVYDIKDSNIELLGSDLEKHVRQHAGDREAAWQSAGKAPGVEIWRIEKFTVQEWPNNRYGTFYDGDSYIILHTYKKTTNDENLSYDLHFWLGESTTQDEAGTAAYKTVELDDHLGGVAVQYREVQGSESARFLSYFPRFVCLQGGVSTGFHHVALTPPPEAPRLYRVGVTEPSYGNTRSHLVVREVPATASSMVQGDVYVLDTGTTVWQFNTRESVGKERFKAAEFVQSLIQDREGQCDTAVFDEGEHGAGAFLSAFGADTVQERTPTSAASDAQQALFRLSDTSGQVELEPVSPMRASLSSSDAFLLDGTSNRASPAIYVWVGRYASLAERRLSLQYAQWYLHRHRGGGNLAATSIMKMNEGSESEAFWQALAD